MVVWMDNGTSNSSSAAARALAPAARAAARACIDGLKCMATMLQQHEGAVGALLGEMVEGNGGEDGGDGDGETLRALAALAGGLHKVGAILGRAPRAQARASIHTHTPTSTPTTTHANTRPPTSPIGAPRGGRGGEEAAGG